MTAPVTAATIQNRGASNVDPREASFYAALAERWWDPGGPFWPLHRLNRLRSGYLRDTLSRHFGAGPDAAAPLAGLRILDVGCGGGILSESMAGLGAKVLGIDVVEKNVEVARHHAAGSGLDVEYACTSATAIADRGTPFDVVLNMEVVEHVPDVRALVEDCTRCLRPGGALVIATINRTLRAWLFAIVGAEYVLRWLPRGTHRWRRFVAPAELESMLDAAGFTVSARAGVRVNPFTRRFSLARSLAVNYMLVAGRTAATGTHAAGAEAVSPEHRSRSDARSAAGRAGSTADPTPRADE